MPPEITNTLSPFYVRLLHGTAIHYILLVLLTMLLFWANSSMSKNSFDKGVTVGQAQMSIQCTQLVLDSTKDKTTAKYNF